MSPRNPQLDLDPAARALRLELERLHAALLGSLPTSAPGLLGPLGLHWPCLGVHLWELPSPALEATARALGAARPRHQRLRLDHDGRHLEADVWLADDGRDRALHVELHTVDGSPHALANHARRTARAIESTLNLRDT